jgi:hypothetical protein
VIALCSQMEQQLTQQFNQPYQAAFNQHPHQGFYRQ